MPGSSMLLKIKYIDSTTKCHSLPRAVFPLPGAKEEGERGGLGRVKAPRGCTEHGGLVLM